MAITLAEKFKIVEICANNTAANATTYDYVCCKNAHKVTFVVQHYGGGGDTDLVLSLIEATDVAAGTNSAVTATFPIWANAASSTSSDTLVRATDAASYTVDTGGGPNHIVVIEWDPAKHTDGYDCISLTDSGGNASNRIGVIAYIEERYPQATPPAAITD